MKQISILIFLLAIFGCSHTSTPAPVRSVASTTMENRLDRSVRIMDRDHGNFYELSKEVNNILCQKKK